MFSLIAQDGKTRKLSLTVIMLSLLIGAGVVLLRLIVIIQYAPMIYTNDTLPPQSTALVLGAGLWFDGTPSFVLVNRVEAAVSLYHDGKIEHLVMSGDGISPTYDEPGAMRSLALNAGVADADILLD